MGAQAHGAIGLLAGAAVEAVHQLGGFAFLEADGGAARLEVVANRAAGDLAVGVGGEEVHIPSAEIDAVIGGDGPQGKLHPALVFDQQGPKPIEKLLTRIPCQVAAKKCPASCTTISSARIASAVRTPIQAV